MKKLTNHTMELKPEAFVKVSKEIILSDVRRLRDEFNAIGDRVEDLKQLSLSNPQSRDLVLEPPAQKLSDYKLIFEEMMEQTDNKEWLLLLCYKMNF